MRAKDVASTPALCPESSGVSCKLRELVQIKVRGVDKFKIHYIIRIRRKRTACPFVLNGNASSREALLVTTKPEYADPMTGFSTAFPLNSTQKSSFHKRRPLMHKSPRLKSSRHRG